LGRGRPRAFRPGLGLVPGLPPLPRDRDPRVRVAVVDRGRRPARRAADRLVGWLRVHGRLLALVAGRPADRRRQGRRAKAGARMSAYSALIGELSGSADPAELALLKELMRTTL